MKLPHQTNGYQRKAHGALRRQHGGHAAATVVNVESLAWGHEGGNNLTFEILDTGEADQSLSRRRSRLGLGQQRPEQRRVTPATDGDGTVTSTAAEVVAAINADEAASELVRVLHLPRQRGRRCRPDARRGPRSPTT